MIAKPDTFAGRRATAKQKHTAASPRGFRLRRVPRHPRSFTLTELLVAMGIIAIIAGVTAISVRTIARDAKLSSANNIIAAALDTARGIAIRDNKLTVVVFRPRAEGRRQYIEIVTAQWTGESPTVLVDGDVRVVDRFAPVAGVNARRLPRGIKVAGPRFHSDLDDEWVTQTHLPSLTSWFPPGQPPEVLGRVIGVMYSGSGTIAMRNSASDSSRFYVDFNNDGVQRVSVCLSCFHNGESGQFGYPIPPAGLALNAFLTDMMLHGRPEDEPFVMLVPFLAVYDDDAARDEGDPISWNDFEAYWLDLVGPGDATNPPGFITRNADRIHFNRYTGVVMR